MGRVYTLLLLVCLFTSRSVAAQDISPSPEELSLPSLDATEAHAAAARQVARRNAVIIGGGAALVGAYGLSSWWEVGFDGDFETANEGWFGRDTEYGGIDKLGHGYSNYATVRLLTPLFESAGNGREEAISLAAWSTIGIYMGVEILDGFSRDYEFSAEDAIANILGTLLGVALEKRPQLDAVLDFRLDYRPSPESDFDPFGDYSGQKYLLVTKADGFPALRASRVLRYLEFAVGYGAEGFNGEEGRRDVYAGVSLNLARLLADGAYRGRMHSTPFQRGTDRLFELVQFPSIAYERWSLD